MRWCQFRLRSVLLVVTTCGILGSAYARHRMLRESRAEYEREMARYEVGLATLEELCEASVGLRDRESPVLLMGKRAAGAAHVERMRLLESRIVAQTSRGVWGDPNSAPRMRAVVKRYREEAEDWLANHGLPCSKGAL